MRIREWLSPSHHMVLIFAAVAVVSAGALGLLSWQVIQQDRQLEAPRRRGLLEAAANTAIQTLTSSLAQLDAVVADEKSVAVPAGVSVITITSGGTLCDPSGLLPFVPTRAPLREADEAPFIKAATLEFQESTPQPAIAEYERLSAHPDRAIRATALNRIAALRRKSGDVEAALRAYSALSTMDDVGVGLLPGGLVAAAGRASAFEERARHQELREAATTLARDLARGRWHLKASEFDYYSALVSNWLSVPASGDPDALARADAAEWLWQQRTTLPSAGRRLVVRRGGAIVVWRMTTDGVRAAIGGPAFLRALETAAVPAHFSSSLRTLDGHDVWGVASADHDHVATRVGAASDALPGTLQVSEGASAASAIGAPRHQLLLLVISVMAVVLTAGTYFIARARGRELRAARLQNDFVASVSHEFRSPLTSLAHIAELLARNRLSTDVQKQQAYEILVGDTNRLREMVEHLLDFGRFDAETVALRLEQVDVGAAVAAIVDEARSRVARLGYTIDFTRPDGPITANVDREAFSRALWNLIDNAVKYSPDCKTVWVTIARERDRVAIGVRDRGLGIPAAEQSQVFTRFVRGEESKARGIKGTGIGLALVKQIVDAHGGEIELTSAVGDGSLFVIKLRAVGGVE